MRVTLDDLLYRLMPRVEAGRALADSEWRTLARVAETLLEGSPARVSPTDVANNVEAFLCKGRSRHGWRIRALLTLVEYAPLLLHQQRFSRLPHAERRALVDRHWIAGSGVFGLCARSRLLVIMGCYGDERAFRDIGFIPLNKRSRFARGGKRISVSLGVAGVTMQAASAAQSRAL